MSLQSVFYVEDDADSRKVMKLLVSGRMKVPHLTILPDSTRFLETLLALTPPPDVILLDIHMTPHDGFAMIRAIRQLPAFADTPIAALTASVMNEEVQRLRAVGFSSVIPKPLDLSRFPDQLTRIAAGEALWQIAEN